MAEANNQEQKVENQENEIYSEKQLSSLDLIWKIGFDELDAWADRFNKRDDIFLASVYNYVEKVKQNQENLQEITEQFSKELKNWEKSAREELLVTTTALQHFFPVKSYEEINHVVDDIQMKTTALLLTPVKSLNSGMALDKYVSAVEQYLSLRKNTREKYFESVKKTTKVLYENQKLLMNLFTKQVKTAIFPFQKYMKNAAESK
ncbi:hypothetical protein HPT25_14785 [Bacillus sp. BRMEA1]|uniref:hypothetical protein n=1 Tax=Neobacillus endophyticus TaxID=2738405 RepID=UPI0015636E9B|nr:hypothetical protein [Neobacillus endophyticus]NRD78624.1 hypothetical protein [Neobacillus endophyticus]